MFWGDESLLYNIDCNVFLIVYSLNQIKYNMHIGMDSDNSYGLDTPEKKHPDS